jgi:L-alanine-DL-glutamate epimerase-like enolase superfamily enzyme
MKSHAAECAMIIAEIKAFPLRIPFKKGTEFDASAWADRDSPAADSLLVRVTTDEGHEGWGEAFGFRAVASAKLAVEELIAPICIGQDATRIVPLMLEVQRKLHVFGRGGPLFFGLSAGEIALWDIAGKAANAPLCRLLGGGVGDLKCYASLLRFTDPAVVRANVGRAKDGGFHALKLHEIEVPAISAARDEVGADVELMVDVNCAWTLNEAQRKVEEIKEFRLKWLEEPIWPPENFDGLAHLRKTHAVPIAAGENVSTLMDFERLLAAEAVDFVQPSVAKMGGISEIRKVFSLAALHNVVGMPHTFYDGPGLLAAIHVTAALGGPDAMIEWRMFDLEAQVYGSALLPRNGRIPVPQKPGLGMDPDPEVIRSYSKV